LGKKDKLFSANQSIWSFEMFVTISQISLCICGIRHDNPCEWSTTTSAPL